MYKSYEKINLGSGSMCLDGFLNVDWPVGHLDGIESKKVSDNVTYRTPDEYMDITNLSHIPDASFSYVRSSHVLEHFCISKTRGILKEWVRILKPGGTIDIVVPDFEDIVFNRYLDKEGKYEQWWEETKNDRGLWWDTPEREPLKTKEMAMMQLLYLNGHHKAAFTFDFLKGLLEEHSISSIERYQNEVMDTSVCIYSLCVRGVKKEQ